MNLFCYFLNMAETENFTKHNLKNICTKWLLELNCNCLVPNCGNIIGCCAG